MDCLSPFKINLIARRYCNYILYNKNRKPAIEFWNFMAGSDSFKNVSRETFSKVIPVKL